MVYKFFDKKSTSDSGIFNNNNNNNNNNSDNNNNSNSKNNRWRKWLIAIEDCERFGGVCSWMRRKTDTGC